MIDPQTTLDQTELERIDVFWRAANYLSVGQIYLLDNPLLREPLRPEHVKPRLLGHWGTTPGLNLIYAPADRVIKARGLDAIWVVGPGHGGPAAVANAYLDGTAGEVNPELTLDEEGLRRLFRFQVKIDTDHRGSLGRILCKTIQYGVERIGGNRHLSSIWRSCKTRTTSISLRSPDSECGRLGTNQLRERR